MAAEYRPPNSPPPAREHVFLTPTPPDLSRRQGHSSRLLVVYDLRGRHYNIPGLRPVYQDGEAVQGGLACVGMHDSALFEDGAGACDTTLWDEQCLRRRGRFK